MKISVAKKIKALDGKVINTSADDPTPFTVGKAIANILISHKGKKLDAFKLWSLAQKFYGESSVIDVDDADFQSVKQIVDSDENYGALVLGQVIECLNEAKDLKIVEAASA